MIKEVIMPKLGQTVEEAVVERWHKQEGDTVEKGEILLEITTDKATLEVESFAAGLLRKALYEEGATVPVNSVIAFIGDAEDPIPEAPPPPAREEATEPEAEAARPGDPVAASPAAAAPASPSTTSAPAVPTAPPASFAAPGRMLISPRARRKAEELKVPVRCLKGSGPNGRAIEQNVIEYAEKREELKVTPVALAIAYQRNVDLLTVSGSGPNGKITKEDAEKAQPIPEPGAIRRVPLTAMRRIVAQRMLESKTTIPHFYIDMEFDMSQAIVLRKSLNESGGTRISFNDMLMRACALAFAKVPLMNVTWGGDALYYRDQVDLGLAVAVEEGLIVPVIRSLNAKSVPDIARDSAELIEKARSKRLTPDDYGNASMTLSNLGMFGVDRVFPIINPGESCILGLGRIAEKVVVLNGGIHIRNTMPVVLACDHRVTDGAIGAQFLQAIKEAMENPSTLIE